MTAAAPSLFEPGGFFGAYRVVRPLGRGGMGWVYLVDGPEGGTQYALKILDPAIAKRSPEFVRRFIREAEFAMNARHPNLVEVYDAGQDDETGLCYLTMEYMPGGSLRTLLEAEGALSIRGAWTIARDIARALRFIEENGLVHRDVKPDNVMFAADGQAKLTDLGITRFRDDDTGEGSQTLAGRVVGTPGYMAPEQLMDAHVVDIRADIYSLGVILYEMLAGRRPNADDTAMSSLAKALSGAVLPDVRESRSDVPARLAELVGAMTQTDPGGRPATVAYLLELLGAPDLLAASGVSPAPKSAARHPPLLPTSRDSRLASALVAVVFAMAVLVGVIVFVLVRSRG